MTSTTSEPCACGCGRLIGPADNHPFFAGPACQQLWMKSQGCPEAERASWRTEQRFFHELWFMVPWRSVTEAQDGVDRRWMVEVANGLLRDHYAPLRPFTEEELEDALVLLVVRWNWFRSDCPDPHWMLPGWATSRRRVRRDEAVDRVVVPSAATLDSVSHA